MSRHAYIERTFKRETYELIELINEIVDEYQDQGFVLTVRQLYYQLVARDIIPNTMRDYKRIASVVNDARLAGLMDWDAIEDRTRSFIRRSRWNSGSEIVRAAANSFHMDMWDNQESRVFVLVEKEALVGVLERVCHRYDVPLLAARGYPSVSVIREFALKDVEFAYDRGQDVLILHLGDHDPSGIDMSRDLTERVNLFAGECFDLRRIALNMDQIEEQRPPENPAKTTDSRFASYMRKFGKSSWELDALSPAYLERLVESHITSVINEDNWNRRVQEIREVRERLTKTANEYEEGA